MKKHEQLGMNAGTASHRLIKDLLFDFVQKAGHVCHRCKKPLTRDDFSVEHIEPWLDSEDPIKIFFDLSNIAYSHRACNSAAGRRPTKICFTSEERKARNAEIQRKSWAALSKKRQQERRQEKYVKYKC